MDKDRYIISATELSKFEYCPYQWYYERVYGRNELRKLAKERNERLGIENDGQGRLTDGVKYHEKFYKRSIRRRKAVIIALIIIFFSVAYFALRDGCLI